MKNGKRACIGSSAYTTQINIDQRQKYRSKDFREVVKELSMLMAYEVTRHLPLEEVEIETPMGRTKAKALSGRKLGIVPILRAGLGMVDGMLNLVPAAKVGHIGLYRIRKHYSL